MKRPSVTLPQFSLGKLTDSRFFHTEKRGEVFELRKALHDNNKNKRKDALKKVIAAITVGKDLSSLFPDVVNCMQTTNIEVKKLVYLYVINYARSQPELAILAVNTFRKDSLDPSPLIRGLAIRTMGCIRLDQITEYLVEPLRRCCKDADPYVRKTAAMCVAKLYDVSPQMVLEQGFLDVLRDLIGDANPMVVANSVAALAEISEISGKSYLKDFINSSEQSVSKLLSALNECTEWSQVFILDALSLYDPETSSDAESVLERVTARLSHANSAVVLSATKLVMKLLNSIQDEDTIRGLQRKLSPPLVTLLSAEPEIQYVALRNMNLIVQKRPSILASDVKMFFCKYNDPVYVKMEKIEIMVRLASERNIEQVLMEFKEYATEVDVDFVRSAVRAIGRSAIKIEIAAEKCINVLLDLIESRVNYVVQEAIVVIKDIFRKYPNRYESIISSLCENLDSLDEPEAKSSMIWILGEYAERIDNADELLDAFMDGFHDEAASVQLQILTATVKLFLKRPSSTQDLVTRILKISTDECNNPDVRDRAYIYWRLLSRNPEAARQVVLCEKPTITDDAYSLDPKLLDKLVDNISMLSSIYHKAPESFITRFRTHVDLEDGEDSDFESEGEDVVERAKRQMGKDEDYVSEDENEAQREDASSTSGSENEEDSEDMLAEFDSPKSGTKKSLSSTVPIEKVVVLAATKAGSKNFTGLEISAALVSNYGQIEVYFTFVNKTESIMTDWKLMFNNNSFGLDAAGPLSIPSLSPGDSCDTSLPLSANQKFSNTAPAMPLTIQAAVKCTLDTFYFAIPFDLTVVFVTGKAINWETFSQKWTQFNTGKDSQKKLSFLGAAAADMSKLFVSKELSKYNWNLVGEKSSEGTESLWMSATTTNNLMVMLEILIAKDKRKLKVSVASEAPSLLRLAASSIAKLLKLSPITS